MQLRDQDFLSMLPQGLPMKVKWRLFDTPMLTLPSLAPQLQFREDSAMRPNWQEGSESSIPTINENSNHIYYLIYCIFLWLYFLKNSNMLSLAMYWTSKVPFFPHFPPFFPIFPHPYHLKNLHPMAEAHSWTMWRAMAPGRNWEILWKWRPLRRSWARWGVGHRFSCWTCLIPLFNFVRKAASCWALWKGTWATWTLLQENHGLALKTKSFKRQASGGSCLYLTTQAGWAWACHRFRSAWSYEVRDWVSKSDLIGCWMSRLGISICLGIKCRVPGPFWCWNTNPWCHLFMQWIPAWKSTGTGPLQVASGSLEFFVDLFQVATVYLMGLIRIDHD